MYFCIKIRDKKINMRQIKDSELVLNRDGSVYHLKLHSEQLADNIILVGDPGRVSVVSSFFSKTDEKVQNREIITHTGWFNRKRMTVMSTGMGPDNIDICLNELNILARWDVSAKKKLSKPRKLNIIRLGTSGALQPDIDVNSYVASVAAIGIDNVINFYKGYEKFLFHPIAEQFVKHTKWPETISLPYSAVCSEKLLKKAGKSCIQAITLTSPGFYGPQFRDIFIPPAFPKLIEKITSFRYNNTYIANFEMETSALYGLSCAMGHNALTICLIIANRLTGKFAKDYKQKIKTLIEKTLYNISE